MTALREWFTILFLGLFIGLAFGYHMGQLDRQRFYEEEIMRLRHWTGKLVEGQLFLLEEKKKEDKKRK